MGEVAFAVDEAGSWITGGKGAPPIGFPLAGEGEVDAEVGGRMMPAPWRSEKASTLAWHMPMSSVWMIATRSSATSPNFLSMGLGCIVFSTSWENGYP
jgi:hypothetical protein